MANVVADTGFSPVRNVYGRSYNASVNPYCAAADAQAIYIGDLVTLTGASSIINSYTYPNVIQSSQGDVFQGVCVAVDPVQGSGATGQSSTIYRAASSQRIVWVCDDPDVLFEVMDVNSGTPIPTTAITKDVSVVVAQGSTVTGKSAMHLDNTTQLTTNTLDLKIVGVVNRDDNTPGSAAQRFLVRINRHRYANQIAGV